MKEDGLLDSGGNSDPMTRGNRVKLEQLGITPKESSNYQAIAAIPEPVFDELVQIQKDVA